MRHAGRLVSNERANWQHAGRAAWGARLATPRRPASHRRETTAVSPVNVAPARRSGPPVGRRYPRVVATPLARRPDDLDRVFGRVADCTRCEDRCRRALEEVVQLAVEIAREGREGRKIGTLFVVGAVDEVIERSRALLLDPLHGHPPDALRVGDPMFRETVKELAQLDGAFLVDDDGTFVSAGRYVDVEVAAPENFLPGLGTRHAAGASISRTTGAIAVVVSQSSVVRVFGGGRLKAEIIPELFLLSRERLLTPSADVQTVPEAGLTLAVSDDGG
jgi:diadenylate cyclase